MRPTVNASRSSTSRNPPISHPNPQSVMSWPIGFSGRRRDAKVPAIKNDDPMTAGDHLRTGSSRSVVIARYTLVTTSSPPRAAASHTQRRWPDIRRSIAQRPEITTATSRMWHTRVM
jgi:hypothetical protein